jgi:hypothetical protein
MKLLEAHVRWLYRLLQHDGHFSILHAQNVNREKLVDRRLARSEEEVVSWAQEYNGRANLFIGRNPRKEDTTVVKVTCWTLDIDPVRPKGEAATDEQHRKAIETGQAVIRKYPGGACASSGNGVLVIYRLAPSDNIKGLSDGLKRFEDAVRKDFETGEVRIDATSDAPRLIKLIGTLSTKGSEQQWRHAHFLNGVNGQLRSADELANGFVQASPAVRNTGELPNYDHNKYQTRNSAEMALAARLQLAGYSPDAIKQALRDYGYMPGREDDHERIVQKLFAGRDIQRSVDAPGLPVVVHNPADGFEDWRKRLDERASQKEPELPTGFTQLDRVLFGHTRGEIFTVAARSGHGKTSWAITIAEHLRKRGRRVLYFSTEFIETEYSKNLSKSLTERQSLSLLQAESARQLLVLFKSTYQRLNNIPTLSVTKTNRGSSK